MLLLVADAAMVRSMSSASPKITLRSTFFSSCLLNQILGSRQTALAFDCFVCAFPGRISHFDDRYLPHPGWCLGVFLQSPISPCIILCPSTSTSTSSPKILRERTALFRYATRPLPLAKDSEWYSLSTSKTLITQCLGCSH